MTVHAPPPVERDSVSVTAAARTTAVLEALVNHEAGVSIRAVASQLGMSRSSVHRILQSLNQEGYAAQEPDGSYSIGPRLVQLAACVIGRSSLFSVADSIMTQLVNEVGESAFLSQFISSEQHAVIIHRVECSRPLRYVQSIGTTIPLHIGATGKAILASCMTTGGADMDVTASLNRLSPDPAKTKAELERVSTDGFAVSIEERLEGAAGVSAPVRSHGKVFGALTVTIPTIRIPSAGLRSIGPIVRAHADDISGSSATAQVTSMTT